MESGLVLKDKIMRIQSLVDELDDAYKTVMVKEELLTKATEENRAKDLLIKKLEDEIQCFMWERYETQKDFCELQKQLSAEQNKRKETSSPDSSIGSKHH